jgi:hypothetical protein
MSEIAQLKTCMLNAIDNVSLDQFADIEKDHPTVFYTQSINDLAKDDGLLLRDASMSLEAQSTLA